MAYLGRGPGMVVPPPAEKSLDYTQLNDATTAALSGIRNKLINGDFRIWQRGTSKAAAVQQILLADRWGNQSSGASTIGASLQSFTLGQTDVPGEPIYFHRSVVSGVSGANNFARLWQRIESVRTFAGQDAVLQVWMKADAPKNITVELAQAFGSGGSPSPAVIGIGMKTLALTTSWQQLFAPFSLPSIAGKTLGSNGDDYVELSFWFDVGSALANRGGNIGNQSGTFDIMFAQLEPGLIVTPFDHRHSALEWSMCERYFWSGYPPGIAPGTPGAASPYSVYFESAGNVSWHGVHVTFPAPMRRVPTMTAYSPVTGVVGKYRNTNQNVDFDAVFTAQNQRGFTISANGNGVGGSGAQFLMTADAEF